MTGPIRVRAGHEWALVVADEETGMFSALTSFGNYSHIWPSQWRGEPLVKFLAQLDMDYFVGKTRGSEAYVHDGEATVLAVKRQILSYRREGCLGKHSARYAWRAIRAIESDLLSARSVDAACGIIGAEPKLAVALGNDWYEIPRTRYLHEIVGFWEQLWPSIIDALNPVELEVAA